MCPQFCIHFLVNGVGQFDKSQILKCNSERNVLCKQVVQVTIVQLKYSLNFYNA